jgi:site-specific DNA-methyltransferase (adenine-specific)
MELSKLTKTDLLIKCEELGIKKCKSKSKDNLVKLIESLSNENSEASVSEASVSEASVSEASVSNNVVATTINNANITIENMCGLEYLKTLDPNSIDLILTDPPYIISKTSGLDKHYNNVKYNEENNINEVKSEEQWLNYKQQNAIEDDSQKNNYIKYGSLYGKKYCVKTDYGNWDSDFTLTILEKFIEHYYKVLKKGGTLIMFFDLWKITNLKELLEKYNFKQIRFIEWIKTNPQPRNSKVNYLTNCREIALLGVKDGCPTFNSAYDNGIYYYPLQGGKNRFHPTQKSLALFEELIKKHSNEGDIVLDTFLGSGTTAIACKNTKRNFKGCELNKAYYDKIVPLL